MKLLLTIILALFLCSCVTIPVPPFGEHIGQLGKVKINVSYSYFPNSTQEQEPTDSMKYAWDQFKITKPKLLKDK